MRLKNFINESRSKSISKNQAFDEILSSCRHIASDFLDEVYIMRGSRTTDDFLHINPGTKLRKSAYTSNYYTLFMNNHPLWKDYPKRQIICSGGSGERAMAHFSTTVYYVFPKDGAKIGICPEDDIWESFGKQLKKYLGMTNLDELNEMLDGYGFSDDNWQTFKKQLENEEMMTQSNTMNSMKLLENILNPDKNGFKVENTNKFSLKPSDDQEVWLDSECILVSYGYRFDLEELFRDEGL